MTLSDLLDEREMPTTDVPICLKLNLLTARDEAMARLAAAQRTAKNSNDDRLASGPNPQVTAALAAVHDLEEQIKEKSITIRLTGLDREEYNKTLLEHPPRPGKQEGYNSATFFMAVARKSGTFVAKTGDVEPISAKDWDRIDKMLTDGEHDRIAQGVIKVNRQIGAEKIDFFGDASGTTNGSSETSGSPALSASRRAASGAGSRKKSTASTSTRKATKSA